MNKTQFKVTENSCTNKQGTMHGKYIMGISDESSVSYLEQEYPTTEYESWQTSIATTFFCLPILQDTEIEIQCSIISNKPKTKIVMCQIKHNESVKSIWIGQFKKIQQPK